MKTFAVILIAISVINTASEPSYGRLIDVPRDFQTIQAGIDNAQAGDTVLVAPGVYRENLVVRRAILLVSRILTTNNPTYIDSTIVDGNAADCCISLEEGSGSTVVRGFTIRNGRQDYGGGVDCRQNTSPRLEYLLITGNRANIYGGGIYATSGVSLNLYRALIVGNRAASFDGAGARLTEFRSAILNHCTVADNDGGNGISFNGWSGEISLRNSIFYGNSNPQLMFNHNSDRNIDLAFCDVENGENGIRSNVNLGYDWDDGNILNDPLFIDPDAGDYRLQDGSPCIDAGDPQGEPDPDGSRADMGALPCPTLFRAHFAGDVKDSETNLPLPNASVFIRANGGRIACQIAADSLGEWDEWIQSYYLDSLEVFHFNISSAGYIADDFEIEVSAGDSLWLDTFLDHSEFRSDPDSLAIQIDSASSAQFAVNIINDGNGPLVWQAVARTDSDAGVAPWALRDSLPVSEITGDSRIEGVIFDGESFYCAGANDDAPNLIYHLDREGRLLDTLVQPGHSVYGFKDLAWDGELIWGSGEDSVYALRRDGAVVHRWWGVYNPINNIAFDTEENILWASVLVNDIIAFDRSGNYLGRRIERRNLRIDGLAYFADDPDSAGLYAVVVPGNLQPPQIHKFDTRTGAARLVHTFPDSSSDFNGAYICRNYDRYQGWVLMTIANRPPRAGGDQIHVRQLLPNNEWLTIEPDSGEIPAGDDMDISVNLRTVAENSKWAFARGEYSGEILFIHNGFGDSAVIPVNLTVTAPNAAAQNNFEIPILFDILSLFPNPFNSTANIFYNISQTGYVSLIIYDITGREVMTLIDENRRPGKYFVELNARNLASGLYLARLNSGRQTAVRKLMLLK